MPRPLHMLAWALAVVIGVPVLLVAMVLIASNTTFGRHRIEQVTARYTNGEVLLQGLSGTFPDHLRLQALTIADPQGAWLRAGGVSLDWSPLPLVFGRLDIERLTAAQVDIMRRPVYGAVSAAPTPRRTSVLRSFMHASLRLPLTLRIATLEVPHLQLAAALAGTSAALSLRAAGRYRSLHDASLQVQVRRLDQLPATYRADLLLRGQRLHASLDLAEQANGPLANVLRLPGLGALAAQLRIDGSRNALAVQLNAHAGPLQAHAGGTVDLTREAARLDLSLQSPAMAPRAGLSWQQASLQVQARGAFTAPATRAQLQLAGLAAGSVRVASLQAQLRGEGQGIALQGRVVGLTLPAPIGDLLHGAPIGLTGQALMSAAGGGVRLDLAVTHPLIDAQAHYQLGASAAEASSAAASRAASRRVSRTAAPAALPADTGTVAVTLPRLAPWATLAHVDLRGHADLSGSVDLRPARRGLTLSGAVAISGGEPRLTALLAPRATLSAALSFNAQGMRLQRSQLAAADWDASAQGSDDQGRLDVRWQLALRRLAGLWPSSASLQGPLGAQGRLSAQGRVQGMLPHLNVQASADADGAVRGAAATLHLAVQASGLPQQPAGQLQISGSLDRAPLLLQARLQQGPDGVLTLQVPQARWKSLQLQGALHADVRGAGGQLRADGQLRASELRAAGGELSLRMARLADIGGLIGAPLGGSLDVQLSLAGADGAQRARLQLTGHDLALGTEQLSVLQLRGDIDEPLRAPRLALTLTGSGRLRGVSAQLSASASGGLEALQLRASARTTGDAQSASQVTLAGTWREARRELTLTSLEARYRQQSAQLAGPARVSFEGGLQVQHLRLTVPPAVIELSGRLAPTLDLRASARGLAPAMLGVLMPRFGGLKLRGHADTEIALRGSLARPTGTITFNASGLGSAAGEVRGLPEGSITARATLAAGVATVGVAIDAASKMRFRINGQVPMSVTQPIALRLNGDMDLDVANAVLEAGGERVVGKLHADAQVDGTPRNPQARGQLTLSGVSVQDYARGLSLSDLSATVLAQGSEVRLTHLSARAGSGTLAASGAVDLAAPGLPLRLTLTGHHAQPLKSDLLTANLDLDITLAGQLLHRQLEATGSVHVNQATINIPNALPSDVAVLHVIRPGQAQAPPPPPAKPLIAQLDLTVNAPTGIFVRGRGVNAEVGGTLHATGNSSHPNISGGFDLINGTVDMAGSTLTFMSGRISFNGTGLHHQIDPTLDFTASTYSGGITAKLQISGYADAPVISLSSMPTLPQDEILARLLFGESVAQLTALQLAGVGAALVSISGVGGGASSLNPLTAVQHALGLNRLVVSSGTPGGPAATAPTGNTPAQNNNGATIQAGRYVTNRIYVGAVQSTNGLTQAQVQVDLTRNLKLQTTLSTGGGTIQGATPQNDPGSSIGVTYQFQY